MSIGNNKLPYPAACGGDSCYTGAMFNHKKGTETVAQQHNTTAYTIDGTPNTPAEPLNTHTDECGAAQSAPYNDQLRGIIDGIIVAGATAWPWNTFAATGTSEDLGACRLEGFKNVQTAAVWHGDFGFTFLDTGYACVGGAAATRKFRTLTTEVIAAHNITFTEHITHLGVFVQDRSYNFSGTWSDTVSCTVAKHGGKRVVTQTLASRDPATYPITITDAYTPGSTTVSQSGAFLPYNGSTIGPLTNTYSSWGKLCSGGAGFELPHFSDGSGGHLTGLPAAIASQIANYYSGFPQLSCTVDICTISETKIELKFTITPTTYSGTSGGDDIDYSGSGSAVFHLTLTYSDELTLAAVKTDAETLAAEWLLGSQTLYPFRTDSNGFVAPFVNYRGAQLPVSPRVYPPLTVDDYTQPEISPGVWHQIDWFDDNASHWQNGAGVYPNRLILDYTGDIQGKPLGAGYGLGVPRGVFDLEHEQWWRNICSGGGVVSSGIRAVGMFTPSYLPANATQWTQENRLKDDSSLMWPCAFVMANADGAYLQKWAETIVPTPAGSYNFARPYGPDRFAFDQTKVYCTDGTHVNQGGVAVPNGALAGYWGGQSVGGVYSGCSVTGGDGTLVLGTLVCPMPTGWTDGIAGDEAFSFGNFRWFGIAPGFGGRMAVSAVYDSGANETTFTYTDSPNILTGDKISVLAFGNVTLGTNLTLTRLSDTTGKVSGNYAGAAYITPYKLFDGTTDGTKWYFANDTRKFTFVSRAWTVDLVGGTVLTNTAAESCLPYLTNCAAVLVASPQAEGFPNSYAASWPAAVPMDTVWIGQFEQWMVDPFWQNYHTLCDGNPQPDVYCVKPYIEARISVRSDFGFGRNETAPTPPAGINLNPTVNPPDNAHPGTGRVPDSLGGSTPDTPWHIRVTCGYP